MVALLLYCGLAFAGPPELEMHGGLRYRWSSWVLGGEEPASAGSIQVALDHRDDLPNLVTAHYQAEPSWYQIVDLALEYRDEWWFKTHVDSDPTFEEIARWALEFGHKGLRLHLETGTTSFVNIHAQGVLEDAVDPRLELPSTSRVEAQYRAYGIGEQLDAGVVMGVSWIRYDAPVVSEIYLGNEAGSDDEKDPSAAVFGLGRRELLGIWIQSSYLESVVQGDSNEGLALLHAETERAATGIAIEGDAVMGLSRVEAAAPSAALTEQLGRPVWVRHAYGIGLVNSTRLLAATARKFKNGGAAGIQGGYEIRTHLFGVLGQSRQGPDGTAVTRTSYVSPDLLHGPYFGVVGNF